MLNITLSYITENGIEALSFFFELSSKCWSCVVHTIDIILKKVTREKKNKSNFNRNLLKKKEHVNYLIFKITYFLCQGENISLNEELPSKYTRGA